uniref:Undecaprenyl phosphate-alpha-4-amino-4-deoxy-L-arabinose arabinosyl transferase n=1 Tax=Pseudomonas aeruginosa TaxID=287 RepID=A0A5E5R7P6_PSEAI|nr:Undecaprenyl phosphate-alpha-4-amino-4-deoxy-L-arabinose arabinosyl transferase [Pseudomonas aeruginosa]
MVFLALWLLLPLAFFSLSRGKLPTYIMPCLLPLALLMGHALVQRLRLGNSVALRGNGLLNLGLALLALAALAYLQLRKPVYREEPFELFPVLLVIGAWAAAGLAQWRYPLRAWAAPLLASWVLIALLPAAMPNHVVQNKTPDLFVAEHLDELTGARHLLSNDLGAASALAWRLRRSDVTLYDTRGELKYGLSYPEHSQRSVPGRHPPVALAGTPGRLDCRAAADQQRQRPLPAGAVAGRRRTLPERQPGPGDPAAGAPESAALLLATLLMTGLSEVAQKLTVEHWRRSPPTAGRRACAVRGRGWRCSPSGSACSAGCCSCNGWKSAAPIRCWR